MWFQCVCFAEPSTQYVISLRAFNNYGKGPVVYDLIYTRDEDGKYCDYFIYFYTKYHLKGWRKEK